MDDREGSRECCSAFGCTGKSSTSGISGVSGRSTSNVPTAASSRKKGARIKLQAEPGEVLVPELNVRFPDKESTGRRRRAFVWRRLLVKAIYRR